MATRISVSGLAHETTNDELRLLFEKFGDVEEVEVIKNRTKKPTGRASVTMTNSHEAQKALTLLNGKDFAKRKLRVGQSPITRGV